MKLNFSIKGQDFEIDYNLKGNSNYADHDQLSEIFIEEISKSLAFEKEFDDLNLDLYDVNEIPEDALFILYDGCSWGEIIASVNYNDIEEMKNEFAEYIYADYDGNTEYNILELLTGKVIPLKVYIKKEVVIEM